MVIAGRILQIGIKFQVNNCPAAEIITLSEANTGSSSAS